MTVIDPSLQDEIDRVFHLLQHKIETDGVDVHETDVKKQVSEIIQKANKAINELSLDFYVSVWETIGDVNRPYIVVMSNQPPFDVWELSESDRKRVFGDLQWYPAIVATDLYQERANNVSFLIVYEVGVIKLIDRKRVDEELHLPVKQFAPFVFVLYSPGKAMAESAQIKSSFYKKLPDMRDIESARSALDVTMMEDLLSISEITVSENTNLRKQKKDFIRAGDNLAKETVDRAFWQMQVTQKKEREAVSSRVTDFFKNNMKWVIIGIILLAIVYLIYIIILKFSPVDVTPQPTDPFYPDAISTIKYLWGLLS